MTQKELELHGLLLGDAMIQSLQLDISKLKRKTRNQRTKINCLEAKLKRYEDESKHANMLSYIKHLEAKIKRLESKLDNNK